MEGDWFLKITHRLSKTKCKGTRMGPKRDLGGWGRSLSLELKQFDLFVKLYCVSFKDDANYHSSIFDCDPTNF